MIVQLYRDNYTTVPTENLITTIYDGFFDGVENWFLTAVVENTDLRTSDLTNLSTITRNQFSSSIAQSIKVSGFFRAKKTGTYRFFTYSNDKNILEIDGDDIIVNNNINQLSFANKSLIAGRYYPLNLYYGGNTFIQYPPGPMTANTTTILGQNYVASASTEFDATFQAFEAFNDITNQPVDRWRSANGVYSSTTGTYTGSKETSIDGVIREGEWLQIELPDAIRLDTFTLTCRDDDTNKGIAKSFYIAGSNNLSGSWTEVYFDSNLTWSGLETKTFTTTNKTPFKYFRYVVLSIYSPSSSPGGTFTALNEWVLYSYEPALECGYIEPNDDGTNSGSTNPDDFIRNATGLTTYYDINPETQGTLTTSTYPLVMEDDTLQGLFRVSPLALYSNRTNFASSKHDILYVASDELFNNFNGTYKNYIQLHEKPIADDNERKRFTQFSSDMSFECELNGRIEVRFRRGTLEPIPWRYAMLILDVERIPIKNI